MRILLDTHTLIWALMDAPQLNDSARKIILNEDNQIYYSSASIWEVQIKHDKNSKIVGFDGNDLIRFCDDAGYFALNITSHHTAETGNLNIKKGHHVNNDPFDRMLLAQAKHEGMLFLTHDRMMQYYDEPSIMMF